MKKIFFYTMTTCVTVLVLSGCSSKETPQTQIIKVETTKQSKNNEKLSQMPSVYELQRKEVMKGYISQQQMPIKTPDKNLRVLVFPYVDQNNILQTHNFQYVKVDEGKWILGEYLLNEDSKNTPKMLTPLKEY